MISIITPVYNGRHFMEAFIQNLIDQNCSEAEHIIVDGGSTDGTVEIIKRYADEYPHIRWVSEKDNGQSDAMNKGIAMARGNILGFLNADDYYEPGILNDVIELFKDLPEPSLLVGNCNVWDDEGKIQWVNKPAHLKLTELLVADESRYPFPVNPSAYFYHRSMHDRIGMYDINEHYVMDLDFILKAVIYGHAVYVNRLLGNFRYIEGTKTFHDMKGGSSKNRYMILIHKYRSQLEYKDRMKVLGMSLVADLLRYGRTLKSIIIYILRRLFFNKKIREA